MNKNNSDDKKNTNPPQDLCYYSGKAAGIESVSNLNFKYLPRAGRTKTASKRKTKKPSSTKQYGKKNAIGYKKPV